MEAPKTCVLKLNIHCDGCQKEVKKILQKIHGVYSFNIDAEQNKVTVSGTVDPNILIMMLAKAGKRAQILFEQAPPPAPPPAPAPAPPPPGPPGPPPGHPNHFDVHFKNLHMGPPQAQQKSTGGSGAIAQLQQLAQFKKLKHMELTQSRGIKMTFRRKNKDKMGNGGYDPNMSIHMNDGHGHGHGHGHGFDNGHGPHGNGHGHPMNHPPPLPPHGFHDFNFNHGGSGGAGPSGTKPPPPNDPFSTFFSDENANGCSVM